MEVDHQEEEMESLNEEATYVPKCCIFDRTKLNTSSRLLMPETEDDGEFSDEDNNSVFRDSAERPAKIRASASAARKSRYNSNNLSYRNPTNKLPTSSPYHLSRHHSPNPAPSNDLNDLDACTDQEQVRDEQQQRDHGLAGLGGLSQDLSRCLDLSEEDEDMIRLAGGQAVADRILAECEARVMRTPDPEITLMPSPRGGETILMQRCCRNYPESDVRSWQTTYGEIRAYARIMARLRPDLLTTRQQNNQEASALDLAALTNKSAVAVYLARLYEKIGYDPNSANSHGHTVLHLLARKGDDCAATLECLLKLQKKTGTGSERLFRIDVVNNGHKTPLDVAVACSSHPRFSTGKDRALYAATIELFHDVIIEEASNIMEADEAD